jgi:hypothetical protein
LNNRKRSADVSASSSTDDGSRAKLGAVADKLLELGCDLYKRPTAVRLVVCNTLLAISDINFKVRSTHAESWSFANGLSFQKTIVAPRVTCRRNRSLGLSCADHLSRGLKDCRSIRIRDDLGLDKYLI